MKKLLCATLDDIDAKEVDVEVSFVRSLPSFSIVGLAQTSIQESKERVKSALSSINFKFPPQKLIVNLAPSDLKKEGSFFDLPIALLIALYKEEVELKNLVVFGELGLDGRLKDTNSIFPIVLSLASKYKGKTILIPEDSFEKISKIPNLNILTASTLEEAIEVIREKKEPIKSNSSLKYNSIKLGARDYYYCDEFQEDFKDIKGQLRAIRASLIASAGFHNILFEGSPGCGKSMCAKRIPFILPPMSLEEILQKAKMDALTNKEVDFTPIRAFRSPHHTASRASIFGGANKSIGEIALANNGAFFADELPYFSKSVLESLREPLQDHKILVSRVKNKIEYKTKFVFISALNPCPCGNLFSKTKECKCSEIELKRYKSKLSAPILDRIELYVQMEEIDLKDKPVTTSKKMFKEVLKAFKKQKQRGQSEFNGKLSDGDILKYCKLDSDLENMLNNATINFELSQRAINNIKKVTRTIADLDGSDKIKKEHLLEALSYRMK
jgi:magnesium chelatase family protein